MRNMTSEEKAEIIRLNSEINVTTKNDKEPYIFISYKSDDRLMMLKIVHRLHTVYGLRVYYDKEFAVNNELWVEQMEDNMSSAKCYGMLSFISKRYLTSYAACMEMMHSQTSRCFMKRRKRENEYLPIVPVNLDEWPTFSDDELDRDTGLLHDNINLNAEKEAFINYYDELSKRIGLNYYRTSKRSCRLNVKDCESIIKSIYDFANINENRYYESTFESFCNTLAENIHNSVYKLYDKEDKVTVFDEEKYNKAIAGFKQTAFDSDNLQKVESKNKIVMRNSEDCKYSLYGKKYTDTQAEMMQRVFEEVLKRHEDVVTQLPNYQGMNCVSFTNYTLAENQKNIPAYFRPPKWLSFSTGGLCLGTSYNMSEKLKRIAMLLMICNEPQDIISFEKYELPTVSCPPLKEENSQMEDDSKKSDISLFWSDFMAYAFRYDEFSSEFRRRDPSRDRTMNFSIGTSRCRITVYKGIKTLSCGIQIPDDKGFFNELYSQKEEIEDQVGSGMNWRSEEGKMSSSIEILYTPDKEDDFNGQFEWLKDTMLSVKRAIKKYL